MISVPVCKTLSDDERDKLAEVMEEVSFDRNERIIAQGDSADAMWVSFVTSSSIRSQEFALRTELQVAQPPLLSRPWMPVCAPNVVLGFAGTSSFTELVKPMSMASERS